MNNTIFIFARQILMRMFTADVGLFGKKSKNAPSLEVSFFAYFDTNFNIKVYSDKK